MLPTAGAVNVSGGEIASTSTLLSVAMRARYVADSPGARAGASVEHRSVPPHHPITSPVATLYTYKKYGVGYKSTFDVATTVYVTPGGGLTGRAELPQVTGSARNDAAKVAGEATVRFYRPDEA